MNYAGFVYRSGESRVYPVRLIDGQVFLLAGHWQNEDFGLRKGLTLAGKRLPGWSSIAGIVKRVSGDTIELTKESRVVVSETVESNQARTDRLGRIGLFVGGRPTSGVSTKERVVGRQFETVTTSWTILHVPESIRPAVGQKFVVYAKLRDGKVHDFGQLVSAKADEAR